MSSNDPTGSFHASNSDTRVGEIVAAYLHGLETGQPVSREALLAEHPDSAAELELFFATHDRLERLAQPLRAPAPTTERADKPGATIRYFGDYELLEEIAQGGMGVVYKARQISLNRPVAVKMILAGHFASESDVKRFQAEAEAAANLRHPGVVAIHEVGVHEGQHFFSMDFVEGQNLSQLVHDPGAPGLSPAKAAEYVRDMAEIVQYAHTQGVLHRDLKPSNVMIDAADRVRITDFGLAKRAGRSSDLTITGQIIGTPSYMSPEQAAAQHTAIGPASDVYALGAILYELVTGRPPFRSDSAVETLRQVQDDDPVRPRTLNPQLPVDLETICLKCLRKVPRRRYASAQDVVDELGRFLRGEPIVARPISTVARTWRWCRRNPAVAALSASVFLLLVTLIGVLSAWLIAMRQEAEDLHERQYYGELCPESDRHFYVGSSARAVTEPKLVLKFGVYESLHPLETREEYRPFLQSLAAKIEKNTGQAV